MAEKLGVKIGIEPGTSERELERKIREKYKNVNINVGVTPASTGATQKYVRQTTRGMQDINTVIAKVIAAYGQLEKMQDKVGKISFSSLSDKLRLDPAFFNGPSGDALKYLMGLQDQIDNMSYGELTTLLKELQNSKKILQPAVDAMHKQQQESINLHNQQKKAREEAAKAAQKAQDARDKAAKSAEKERTEIIKTRQAIKLKLEEQERLRKDSGLTDDQMRNFSRLDIYASGAKDAADFDWLLSQIDDDALGLSSDDLKLVLSDITKSVTYLRQQITSTKKEVSAINKLTEDEQKELIEKEKTLQDILVLQQRLKKLMSQTQKSGVTLELDQNLYSSGVTSAAALANIDPVVLADGKWGALKSDLQHTLALGGARYSAYTRARESETQLANLNHQITEYIENNSKIKNNKALYSELYNLHQEIKSGSVHVDDAQQRFADLQAQFAALNLETMSLSDRLIKLFKDHLNTAIAMAGLHALQNAMRNMVQAVIDIDTAMTELKKVTNLTEEAYDKFLDRAIDKATILGAKVSDVVTATADFARLGWSVADAEQLADAAIIYKNVGDGIDDISTASQSIISTMKAFGYSATEAIDIVNKFNYVGNNFAVTSADIGEALQRSASALEQSNNSLDESIALIVAGNSTVQNADVVGTALKTLSLRLSTTKTELEALGEDTDGAAESTSEYRSEILAITRAAGDAVDIMDDTGTAYKSTYQILKELSVVWDSIEQKEQQSLLYMLGGARQANTLSSILKNFTDAEAVVSQLGEGLAADSAIVENEKYLDSINGKLSQMNALFQELSNTVIDSDLVKGLLDVANAFLEIINSLTEIGGALPIATSLFAGLMATGNKTFFQPGFFKEGQSFIESLKAFRGRNDISLYGLNFDRREQASKVHKLGVFSRATWVNDASQVRGMFHQKFESTMDKSVAGQVNNLIDKYGYDTAVLGEKLELFSKSLEDVPNGLTKRMEGLKRFVKGAAMAFAVMTTIKIALYAIDEAINTIDERKELVADYANKISEANDELKKLRELESLGQQTRADTARIAYLNQYIDLLKELQEEQQLVINRMDLLGEAGIENLFTKTKSSRLSQLLNSTTSGSFKAFAGYLYEADDPESNSKANEMYLETLEEKAELTQLYQEIQAALANETDETYIQLYQTRLNDIISKLSIVDDAIATAADKGIISIDVAQRLADATQKLSEASQNIEVKTWNQIADVSRIIQNAVGEIQGDIDWTEELKNNTENAERLRSVLSQVEDLKVSEINSTIDNMQESLSTVISAYQEYNTYGGYSLDTLQALTELEPRYLNMLIDEEGSLKLNKQAIDDLTQARMNELRIKIVQNAIDSVSKITDEAAATEYLTKATVDLNNATYDAVVAQLMLATTQADLSNPKIRDAIEGIINQTNVLLNAVSAFDGLGLKGSGAVEDAAKKAEQALKDEGDAMLAALDKRKKALQDELDALEEKYELEDKEFELQKRINAYQAAQANKTARLYTHDKGWQWVADPTKVKEAQDAVEEYQKEIQRDSVKKSIQDQIDAIDDLRDKVQDSMDSIGNSYMDSREDLARLAEFENMTLDNMGQWAEDYAGRVKEANAGILTSYNNVASGMGLLLKGVGETQLKLQDFIEDTQTESEQQSQIMDGEMAYYEQMAEIHGGKYVAARDELAKYKGYATDTLTNIGDETQEFYAEETEKFTMYVGDTVTGYIELGNSVTYYTDHLITETNKQIDVYNRAGEAASNYFKTVASHLPTFNPVGIYVPKADELPEYHTGGVVRGVTKSARVSGEFLKYMNSLEKNEVPAILQAGEYVLTQKNQMDILSDRATLVNSVRSGGHTTIEIGDIVISQPTGNIESLSKAIVQKLPNQIMKDLYSK